MLINLTVATSLAALPSLTTVIERFSRLGALTWLLDGSSPVPTTSASVPVVAGLDDLDADHRVHVLVAPVDENTTVAAKSGRIMRAVERCSYSSRIPSGTVVLDDFSQLELLASLPDHPGLSRLLECRDWSAADFRASVLRRYAGAIEALRSSRRAAVFGAQRLGEFVGNALNSSGNTVAAFLDNSTSKHGTSISGTPVLPLSALSDKELPIIIATTRFSNSIARQLESDGRANFLPYSVMSLLDPDRYPDEIPYIGIQQDLAEHAPEYLGLFLSLSDRKSRLVLDGLLRYRLDYDSRFAAAVSDEYARQYFDTELIKFSGKDVFVDLGGYDGDTAEKFIEYSGGSYTKIYLFEPDENLLTRATERLKGSHDIEFVPAGAYSKDGELRFAASGRTNGAISESGELVVPVRKLDSVVTEAPTIVKMDIEGAETEALRGAASLIRTTRPKLAVAAYHFAQDLWWLVDVVREINPDYRFYLRHYSETGLESVIYAI